MRHRCLTCASLATLLVAWAGFAAAADADPGHEIAWAIALLAKGPGEVDLHYLTQYLKLPNLQRDMTWQPPSTEVNGLSFSAVYDPSESVLGIAKVTISRQASLSAAGKLTEFHTLTVFLKPGHCPDEATLADAMGSKAFRFKMRGPDGGPSYEVTSFSVHDLPTHVSFIEDHTCTLTIAHTWG